MDKAFRVTLCVHPVDEREAEQCGLPLCHLAYCIGSDGRLWRGALGIGVRGGLLGVSDRDLPDGAACSSELIRELKRECDARGYSGVLCDFERPPDRALSRFACEASSYLRSVNVALYLPEAYASAAPSAKLLISSAVSGGSFADEMARAVDRYGAERLALEFDPVCMDFAMPSPHADGESRFAMFDDARSLLRKLDAARRAGISEAFVCYPDACGISDELRKF